MAARLSPPSTSQPPPPPRITASRVPRTPFYTRESGGAYRRRAACPDITERPRRGLHCPAFPAVRAVPPEARDRLLPAVREPLSAGRAREPATPTRQDGRAAPQDHQGIRAWFSAAATRRGKSGAGRGGGGGEERPGRFFFCGPGSGRCFRWPVVGPRGGRAARRPPPQPGEAGGHAHTHTHTHTRNRPPWELSGTLVSRGGGSRERLGPGGGGGRERARPGGGGGASRPPPSPSVGCLLAPPGACSLEGSGATLPPYPPPPPRRFPSADGQRWPRFLPPPGTALAVFGPGGARRWSGFFLPRLREGTEGSEELNLGSSGASRTRYLPSELSALRVAAAAVRRLASAFACRAS